MTIAALDGLDRALIVANIYRKPDARFGAYDGVVLLELGEQRLEVPLTEKREGSWCLIAEIERVGERHYFVNRNRVTDIAPRL